MGKYFGTDGIRGRVGTWPVSADFMLRLGRAAGTVLTDKQGRATVVIGKDTRVSGYMFESALEAGLVAAGADVRLLGPAPTPAVAWLTRSLRASAGIVISASHNSYQDNGIKFFGAGGEKLPDDVEAAIEAELDREFRTVAGDQLGKAARIEDAGARYAEHCKSTLEGSFSLKGQHIVLDCAHGATYQVAPRVFRELGAELTCIGCSPDGFNINQDVGSTAPGLLRATVAKRSATLGIAFDGDGDRVQMVDAAGNLADGDDLLYVLARDWQRRGHLKGPVVGTLMSNVGLEHALADMGVALQRANVGDRHVLRQLKESGGILGGETSGHVLCLDRTTTGDGIVSALAVLEALASQGEDLATARAGLVKLPQTTINVRAEGGAELVATRSVQDELQAVRSELGKQGRVVLRPSGTEPVVRVTIESADADQVARLSERLSRAVRAAASDRGSGDASPR